MASGNIFCGSVCRFYFPIWWGRCWFIIVYHSCHMKESVLWRLLDTVLINFLKIHFNKFSPHCILDLFSDSKLEWASDSLGGLVKIHCWAIHPSFRLRTLVGLWICIFNKFPVSADVAGLRTTVQFLNCNIRHSGFYPHRVS